VRQLAARYSDDGELVDELYLTFFSRFPSVEERTGAMEYLKGQASRVEAAEDLAWTMLNTLEFGFNH
jgi:hypothetical protein